MLPYLQGSKWQGSPLRAMLVYQVFSAAAARADWGPLLPAIVGDLAEVRRHHSYVRPGMGDGVAKFD